MLSAFECKFVAISASIFLKLASCVDRDFPAAVSGISAQGLKKTSAEPFCTQNQCLFGITVLDLHRSFEDESEFSEAGALRAVAPACLQYVRFMTGFPVAQNRGASLILVSVMWITYSSATY